MHFESAEKIGELYKSMFIYGDLLFDVCQEKHGFDVWHRRYRDNDHKTNYWILNTPVNIDNYDEIIAGAKSWLDSGGMGLPIHEYLNILFGGS